jgi:GGDEF domain-containing protein
MSDRAALVIVGDVEVSSLLGMLLSLVGYEPEIVHSAGAGLARLVVTTPSVVLLDMHLDDALGSEDVLYQVRGNPSLKETRIVVIAEQPSLGETVAKLADHILFRPFEIEGLKGVIASLREGQPVSPRSYFCDPVTGMYNRDFFYSRLEHAIQRTRRRPDFVFAISVIVIGLQELGKKWVPDQTIFNAILRDAANSLTQNLRPTDTVARLAHARFATLHEELRKPGDIDVIIKRIYTVLTPPFQVGGQKYRLTFRIGRATSEDRFSSAEDLVALAESNL